MSRILTFRHFEISTVLFYDVIINKVVKCIVEPAHRLEGYIRVSDVIYISKS